MKQQQGAALVIVMALLSGALMLSMSGMQSALIDERLAGNYRASAQAQMTAESTLATLTNMNDVELQNILGMALNDEFKGPQRGEDLEELLGGREALEVFLEPLLPSNYKELSLDDRNKIYNPLVGNLVLEFKVLEDNRISITATDDGLRRNARGQSRLIYAFEEDTSVSPSPFQSPIVGCEGVTSAGGSTISSYRSSEGPWNGQPGSFAERDIPLIRTTADNANVVLGGSEEVHGGIKALGTVALNGSSQVYGSISANGDLNLNTSNFIHGDVTSKGEVSVGSGTIKGSVFADSNITLANGGSKVEGDVESFANVIFSESGRVDGVVKAGGDVDLRNWGASVGKGIYAQGEINSPRNSPYNPPEGHVDEDYRNNFFQNTSVSIAEIEEIEPQPCDTIDFAGNSLREEVSRYQSELNDQGSLGVGNWPYEEWRITPERIERFHKDDKVWSNYAQSQENSFLEKPSSIYYLSSLKLNASPTLRINGDVILVIDGDFNSVGGGNGIIIEDGSSLTVFVGGRVSLGSNIKMPETQTLNFSGRPAFSIFSSYESDGFGVNIDGGGRVVANVYAPYTKASINSGGGLFGSVNAKHVDVFGGGVIVYDELLAGAFGDPSNGSPGTGGSGGWRLVDWQ